VEELTADRRTMVSSNQYESVCKNEFKSVRKRQKKQGKGIKGLTKIVKNGHTAAIKHLLIQNKWIMGMLASIFLVLLAGILAVILKSGVA